MKNFLVNVTKKGWLKRQDTLKEWRNQIWGKMDEQGIKTYIDWHEDFFTRFYRASSSSCVLLDIGCGYMIKNFHQAGKLDNLMGLINSKYIGIDPFDDWFVKIERFNIELHVGCGEELPFNDNQFDAIMLLGVLDHVVNPIKVLSEAYRVVKKEGRLWFANSYIEGNSLDVLKAKLSHRFGFDAHHRYVWTTRNLQLMVSKAKFSIIRTDRCLCDTSFYIEAIKND